MMNLAVLGAGGFIGNRVVERLHLEDKAEVRPIVRSVARQALAGRFALDVRVADALDTSALADAFRGCDVVVHAVAGDPATITGSIEPVYRAAITAGVRRIVYLSSASVHGQAPTPGTSEASPLDLHQPLPYNRAKIRAEQLLVRLGNNGRIEIVVLRPGIVYGPRSSWTAGLADDLLAGRACLAGDGICNGIYVDNLVEAIYRAAVVEGIHHEVFLVGDRETYTWPEFFRPIVAALGRTMDEVHRMTEIPAPPTQRSFVEWLQQSRMGKSLLPLFPVRLRHAVYSGLTAWSAYRPEPDPWALPVTEHPSVRLETALLHRCTVRLPHDKAQRMLGYVPVVSFEEACRRSVRWLQFAGYPVTESVTHIREKVHEHG